MDKMSLKDIYQRFLELPNPISLSENASLHYIPTLTTLTSPAKIVQHLESQEKRVVKTKSGRILSAVEGSTAVALEVETTLEFVSGGGTYLPGLENFVVDKIATLPTTHIVHFDADRKISQVRISWDQGALLKQADIIGSRGRNWPVVDGKDQIRLINSSSTAAPAAPVVDNSRGRTETQSIASSRNVSPSKRHIKDPHASLDLFSPKATDENEPRIMSPNAVAPRSLARPPPREMSELFAAGHEDHEPGSPKKMATEPVVAPKGVAGNQKFAASRLFSDDADEPSAVGYKSNPAKYNHFDLGDPDEQDSFQHHDPAPKPKAIPMRATTNKHNSQWDFADFNTPEKVNQKVRDNDVVHFSLERNDDQNRTPTNKPIAKGRRDNESHFEMKDAGTPIERHAVPQARKDAETHFQFKDTATPAPNRTSARPGSSNDRMGLYSNSVFGSGSENGKPQDKAPLSTITTNAHRTQDFDSHWSMSNSSPANDRSQQENKPLVNHRKQPSHQMDTHWDNYPPDEDAVVPSHKGLRKGTESHWNTQEPLDKGNPKQKQAPKSFWDF